MLVMKFGGTSVADADRIKHAADLVRREASASASADAATDSAAPSSAPRAPVAVVTSAMGGVTDDLVALGQSACEREPVRTTQLLETLRARHETAAKAIVEAGTRRDELLGRLAALFEDLEQLLHGIQLLQEISPRSSDLLLSFGERLAAPLFAAALTATGANGVAVDAREMIVTEDGFGPPAVDLDESRARTRERLLPVLADGVPVVTGFIASTRGGSTTTLGRGGSDYTATLIGSFLDADEVWIWTDVDGVMTADPRMVAEARVLEAITYREAAEMAYFGSRVLHPRTMTPAREKRIPVVIRNTFRPERPGTRITDEPSASALGVKVVTSVADLALITVEGNGMIGVPGVVRRVFTATAAVGINVYMISQASSEHNISFVVHRDDAPRVVRALEREFEPEVARRQIDRVDRLLPVGIVAVIGEGMKGTPGISQRMFTALGVGRVNVLAIAQGSSELNLSVVVQGDDLPRAVGAVHSRFGLTRDTHLFLVGKGLVGKALIRQLVAVRRDLAERRGIGLSVMGVCGASEMLLAGGGLDDEALGRIAGGEDLGVLGGEARPDDAEMFARIAASRWLDVAIVDLTAEDNGAMHADALRHGFHVVTANKKPMSGPWTQYEAIRAAKDEHGAGYFFETTFGAGLPALSSLQDLINTGDVVHRVTGCFSGTLGYLCAELEAGRPFSAAVRTAVDLGYTEPHPREDLSGIDVARKAIIIARQLGATIELGDVELEGLLPPALETLDDADTLLARLPEIDAAMAARAAEAQRDGRVLRFVADITPERVSVGLRAVPADSPTGQLRGPDNILVFETERYNDYPLVIRGPGAGAEVTAAGVLGDILKIVRTA